MNLRSKKGFTLVELIIVIAILGVIVAIAAPSLTGVLASARVNADYDSAASIAKSVRIWLTDGTSKQITARQALINDTWVSLAALAEDDEADDSTTGKIFDSVVNASQLPEGLPDSAYYIMRSSTTDRIVIYVGTAAPEDDPNTAYNYNITANTTVTAGVVYVENEIIEQDTTIAATLWE